MELAADTIITTALAIVVGKCISNGNEGNGDDKDNFSVYKIKSYK